MMCPRMRLSRKSMHKLIWILLFLSLRAAAAADNAQPVTISEDAETVTLDNGVVVAAIKKANANLLSLKVRGVEFISKGQGYWNVYGKIPGQASTQEKPGPAYKTATTPINSCAICLSQPRRRPASTTVAA